MNMREIIDRARLGDPAADCVTFDFCFESSAEVFAGHFPGQPILPGIFQVEMTRAAAEWKLGRTLAVWAVRKAKFTRPVRPGETLRLSLKLTESAGEYSAAARFSVGEQTAGETQLRLGVL